MADETTNQNGEPAPEPTATPPAATPPAEPAKTFTQAELDKVVKERLQREREKHADYDQLKAAADELAKLKESQLSEQEKLQKRLAELEEAKARAETTARETLIRSKVIAEAAKLNFNDPEDAYRLIDASQLTVNNGTVEGAFEAVKALAESRTYLIKQQRQSLEPFNPAGGGQGPGETAAQKRARIYGSGGSMFDAGRAEQMGGGVVWPTGVPTDT